MSKFDFVEDHNYLTSGAFEKKYIYIWSINSIIITIQVSMYAFNRTQLRHGVK